MRYFQVQKALLHSVSKSTTRAWRPVSAGYQQRMRRGPCQVDRWCPEAEAVGPATAAYQGWCWCNLEWRRGSSWPRPAPKPVGEVAAQSA